MASETLSIVCQHQSERVLTIFDHVVMLTIRRVAIVIVAGTASGAIRDQTPVACLWCIKVIFFVAGCAISNILGPDQSAPIV